MNIPSAAVPQTSTSGAPQAGLGSLLKPNAPDIKGMPAKDMARIMQLAKNMSDAQLADVLSGRSMDIPQFAAMTEAMGRKRLRTAVQGAQAQQQLAKPNVKQQALADLQMSGIDQLPAPNMETVDMAEGGVIAFEKGGTWFDRLRDSFYSPSELYLSDVARGKKADMPEGVEQLSQAQIDRIRGGKAPGPYEFAGPDAESIKNLEESEMRRFKREMAEKEQREKEEASAPKPVAAAKKEAGTGVGVPAAGGAASASKTDSGLGGFQSYLDQIKKSNEDYLGKLEGMSAKQREGLAQIKRQGQGEALMNLAGALFSAPTMSQALAKGAPLVASTAAATRKEARGVENLANEYDMNLAKARQAAAAGNMNLALEFQKAADLAKYRGDALAIERMNAGTAAARLGQAPDQVRIAEYIKANPEMARYFPNVGKQERISMDKALEQWTKAQGDISARKTLEAQGIYSPLDLYNSLNLGSVQSATIPGQGAPIIGKL